VTEEVFARGSKTYYNASKFFPSKLRHEVTILYSFVRIVDDFVDTQPANAKAFLSWELLWQQAWKGQPSNIKEIDEFVHLAKKRRFKKEWIESFFASMRFDLEKHTCHSQKECEWYIHGSAEVIGLMMAHLMRVPKQAHNYAATLGKSMQYINFIRDIDEDRKMKRKYLQLNMFPKTAKENAKFIEEVRSTLQQYTIWKEEAEKGFKFIPYTARVAVMTANDMYKWTAEQINKNPLRVFDKKIKPSKTRIHLAGIKNMVKALWI
jgi:phytoene synthase